MRGVEAERRHSPAKSCSELLRGGLGWKKMAGREVEIEAGVRWASPHCARMNDLVIILQTLMPERVASIQPTSVYFQPAHHPSIHPSFLLLCVCSLVNHHLSIYLATYQAKKTVHKTFSFFFLGPEGLVVSSATPYIYSTSELLRPVSTCRLFR